MRLEKEQIVQREKEIGNVRLRQLTCDAPVLLIPVLELELSNFSPHCRAGGRLLVPSICWARKLSIILLALLGL